MKSGNLQTCSMGEFLVLTVLIHLCLRLNWLSRYVIVMLKNCPSKTHESPSKQNIVTVRKIHMVNKFTVSRVKGRTGEQGERQNSINSNREYPEK
jgi:hypothetical protein